MSEKRFFVDKIDSNQYAVYDRLKIGYIKPLVYTDWTVGLDYTQSVCDLLNDCDEKMNEVYEKLIIGKGSSEIIDMIKFGDKLNGVAIKELFDRNKKLEEENEQLKKRNKFLEEFDGRLKTVANLYEENDWLKSENKKLQCINDQLEERLENSGIGIALKMDCEDDTPFQFNSNQARLYLMKNISPNGVVRLGNGHKAQWRIKDVREISQELPLFEDFTRETFMQMRNKFHKFDKDVLGRIIYNIYIGTFEGLI